MSHDLKFYEELLSVRSAAVKSRVAGAQHGHETYCPLSEGFAKC